MVHESAYFSHGVLVQTTKVTIEFLVVHSTKIHYQQLLTVILPGDLHKHFLINTSWDIEQSLSYRGFVNCISRVFICSESRNRAFALAKGFTLNRFFKHKSFSSSITQPNMIGIETTWRLLRTCFLSHHCVCCWTTKNPLVVKHAFYYGNHCAFVKYVPLE